MTEKWTDKEKNPDPKEDENLTNPDHGEDNTELSTSRDLRRRKAPACVVVWEDEEAVLACASEEDGAMALELLRRVRIKIETQNEGSEDPDATPDEQSQPNAGESAP